MGTHGKNAAQYYYSYTAHAAAWCSEADQMYCNNMIMIYEVGEVTLLVISMWLLLTNAVELPWLAPGGLILVCIV